jgi:hypothetical protein
VTTFLYWNPDGPNWTPDGLKNNPADAIRLDNLVTEMNQLMNQPTADGPLGAIPWNQKVVASGRKVGDQTLWRFTFSPGIYGVKVQVNNSPVEILAEGPEEPGAWYMQPAGTQIQMLAGGYGPAYEAILAPPTPPAPPAPPSGDNALSKTIVIKPSTTGSVGSAPQSRGSGSSNSTSRANSANPKRRPR